eukprot:gnl/Hemi2/16500_TR5512_c0_g1_i1.p1 gnl/Hemi2/16500_TR5512_c0_g1~~gnl/Hemi2/16500_TR5512_c0_g1_i1.p1  ORF type:complete len:282 (+),score=92.76 gnl/Hemi2/16500_TR5512_c0_g1_i1:41-847(+)
MAADGHAPIAFGVHAQLYSSIIEPVIFHPYTADLLQRVGLTAGQRVLDVATGTGVVARAAAKAVGPSGRVVAADLAEGMLAYARAQPSEIPIEYIQASAEKPVVPDASVDVVTIQQGLQFFPDKAAALTACKNALVPGGKIFAACWRSRAENQWFASFEAAFNKLGHSEWLASIAGPTAFPDPAALTAALEAAGFRGVTCETVTKECVFESAGQIFSAMHMFPCWAQITALSKEEETRAAVEDCLRPFTREGGKVHLQFSTNVASGTA